MRKWYKEKRNDTYTIQFDVITDFYKDDNYYTGCNINTNLYSIYFLKRMVDWKKKKY